jgi:hypothetical protein
MNPTAGDLRARVAIPGASALVDALSREGATRASGRVTRAAGAFEVPVPARTVRMFAIEA